MCEAFPGLYRFARSRGAMVVDLWVDTGDSDAWDPKFERLFNDWELEAVQAFLGVLNNCVIRPQTKDKIVSKGNASRVFTVKDYFNLLEGAYSDPVNIIWNPHIPSKFGFFAWEAWWGKVLTTTHLRKRGFHLASKCPFCGMKEEELEHIPIHCPSIWGQWTDLLSAFGANWVCPLLVKDFLLGWMHFPIRKKAKVLWRAAPLIFFWAIWKGKKQSYF